MLPGLEADIELTLIVGGLLGTHACTDFRGGKMVVHSCKLQEQPSGVVGAFLLQILGGGLERGCAALSILWLVYRRGR